MRLSVVLILLCFTSISNANPSAECASFIHYRAVNKGATPEYWVSESVVRGIHLAHVVQDVEIVDWKFWCPIVASLAETESTYNYAARNGSCKGMFQFSPGTAKELLKEKIGAESVSKNSVVHSSVLAVLFVMKYTNKYSGNVRRVMKRYTASDKNANKVVTVLAAMRKDYSQFVNEEHDVLCVVP